MEKTIINIKTDKKLKEEAQKVARELGLPLETIINAYLRELVRKKRVVFSVPPTPNKHLQILLGKLRSEKQNREKIARPISYEEAIEHLDSL